MNCGWAASDITPEAGIHMGGYWGRTSGATGIHDPLFVRALVFSHDGTLAALITLDVIGLDADTVRDLRLRVAKRTKIAAGNVMICCSHTHAGPLTMQFRGMGNVDYDYLSRLLEVATEVVANAVSSTRPVCFSHAMPKVTFGVNRRNAEGGPVASRAHVLRIDRDDGCRAVLFCYACHPAVLGNCNHSISGDYPTAAVRFIERETNAFPMFVNGACGDINPRIRNGGFKDVEEIGSELGNAVVKSFSTATEIDAECLQCRSICKELPLIDPPSKVQIILERLALKLKATTKRAFGGDYWSLLALRAQLHWAEEMLELIQSGTRGLTQSFELQGFRIGSAVLLGMEGEMFVRYQHELEKNSPFKPTIVCGLANGCIGYVPTADEYQHGGYEVGTPYTFKLTAKTSAYRVYPSIQMLSPESERILREAALHMLTKFV